jgi:hypothetical protein
MNLSDDGEQKWINFLLSKSLQAKWRDEDLNKTATQRSV